MRRCFDHFSSEGIVFTPVPIDSSSTLPPVMLDLQIDFFLKYPWRQDEVVVAPADVYLDCAPEHVPRSGEIFMVSLFLHHSIRVHLMEFSDLIPICMR
jgi:hypothetical protein